MTAEELATAICAGYVPPGTYNLTETVVLHPDDCPGDHAI